MGGRRQFSGWLNSEHEEELLRVTVNSEGEELNLSERDADYLDSSSEMSEWREDQLDLNMTEEELDHMTEEELYLRIFIETI